MKYSLIQFYNIGNSLFLYGLERLLQVKEILLEKELYEDCAMINDVLLFFDIDVESEKSIEEYKIHFKSHILITPQQYLEKIFTSETTKEGRILYDSLIDEKYVEICKKNTRSLTNLKGVEYNNLPLLYGLGYVITIFQCLVENYNYDFDEDIFDLKTLDISAKVSYDIYKVKSYTLSMMETKEVPRNLYDYRRILTEEYNIDLLQYIHKIYGIIGNFERYILRE